jgi:hypothetical protein
MATSEFRVNEVIIKINPEKNELEISQDLHVEQKIPDILIRPEQLQYFIGL